MDELTIVRLTDARHSLELCEMMAELYREDPPATGQTTREQFVRTIDRLLDQPESGSILLLQFDDTICGYAILVPYWSNEYGGTLLFLDELFVKSGYRNRGIGTAFLNSLKRDCPPDTVRICLEVSDRNAKARRLYQSLGFIARPYTTMTLAPDVSEQ
jgi:GNAT superfamily N-acetyltransferase